LARKIDDLAIFKRTLLTGSIVEVPSLVTHPTVPFQPLKSVKIIQKKKQLVYLSMLSNHEVAGHNGRAERQEFSSQEGQTVYLFVSLNKMCFFLYR